MLGSSFALAGGAVLATAGPASASNAGGGQNCNGLSGSGDISAFPPIVSGPVTDCNSNRGGTLTAIVDVSGGVSPGSIAWDTGKATSLITIQVINIDFAGTGCAPGDVEVDTLLAVTAGPYEGTGGINHFCGDISGFPVVVLSLVPGTVLHI
jgi:hypothetical protein